MPKREGWDALLLPGTTSISNLHPIAIISIKRFYFHSELPPDIQSTHRVCTFDHLRSPSIAMLSTIARAAIRRVGAGAIHPSTNRVFQSIWHLQSLRTYDNADGTLPSTDASFILRRSLATVAKVPATSSKPKAKKAPKKNATKKLKKKVASKPKSAIGRPKKVLTKEEETKLRIRSLKKVALSVPKMKPSRPWLVFIVEYIAENHTGQQQSLGLLSKAASAKFKSLSPSEVEVRY